MDMSSLASEPGGRNTGYLLSKPKSKRAS